LLTNTDLDLTILGGKVEGRIGVEVLLVDVDLLGSQELGRHLVEPVLGGQVSMF
jgi:hypothetical protein